MEKVVGARGEILYASFGNAAYPVQVTYIGMSDGLQVTGARIYAEGKRIGIWNANPDASHAPKQLAKSLAAYITQILNHKNWEAHSSVYPD